jgi:hypothetical protein
MAVSWCEIALLELKQMFRYNRRFYFAIDLCAEKKHKPGVVEPRKKYDDGPQPAGVKDGIGCSDGTPPVDCGSDDEQDNQRLFARHLFCAVRASCKQVSGM